MNKEKKLRTKFHKTSDSCFQWKDIKDFEFQDDDYITSSYVEPFYSENNSWDGHFLIEIQRYELETDDEFARRVERVELDKKWAKERRYESYLKLKKEFEGETNNE